MNLYLSDKHSDEDDNEPVSTGKLAMIFGSTKEILELCKFFSKVEKHIIENDHCHMHFRDHLKGWNKIQNVDIEINTEV